ncbi:MAG: MFS transporter [Gammaproteobacteria bacterium]|nr:MFS transporter [Gammaproteobacteria bacterium]
MFFLGFSAGLPYLLIFGTLSIWLTQAGINREIVTEFSWAALGYSFKFVWAPIVDKLPLPWLHAWLGRRRSWLLLAQLSIVSAIVWMSMTDPVGHVNVMAYAAILLGFSAATQDIAIDAYRIESQSEDYQAAMSATYIAGYRIGMIISGFFALKMNVWFGGGDAYVYAVWQKIFLIMAGLMLIGVITTLLIPEPDINRARDTYLHSLLDYARFLFLFAFATSIFILAFVYLNPAHMIDSLLVTKLGMGTTFSQFIAQVARLSIALLFAVVAAYSCVWLHVVNISMVKQTYLSPIADFFQRYKKTAVSILLLIGFYRVSDIVLGVVANVFYLDMGFSMDAIAEYGKLYGVVMTILGGFVGGILSVRYGVMRILLLGAVLSAATNVLFIVQANLGNDLDFLKFVIAADNLSAGLAGAAFVAYMSSLTNISFTATQYAIFSSLMTLLPKVIGGYSGSIVNATSYQTFFLITALMGIPVILLVIYLIYRAPAE